jgi:hypothetical protein
MTEIFKESMMKTRNLVLACCLAGSLVGCSSMSTTEKRTATGAGIGAAGGALIAGLTRGSPLAVAAGATIGAVAGGAGGWLYDRHEKSEGN